MVRVLLAGLAAVDLMLHVEEMPARPEKYRASDAVTVCGGGTANAAVGIARLGGQRHEPRRAHWLSGQETTERFLRDRSGPAP